MTVRVLDGRSLGHAEADAWSEIQAAQAEFASPFFCPEFTMAMARARSDVRVAVMESGGEEVGFFPFHDLGDGTAEPAGGRASDYHGAIVRAGADWSVPDLFRAAGIRSWPFRHVLACQEQFQSYHATHSRSLVMDLSRGFDAYASEIRARGSRAIEKVARLAKPLQPMTVDRESRAADDLEWLIRCKSEQYQRSGLVDRLASPWLREALAMLHAVRSERFAGMLSVLRKDSETIAAHFGIRSRSVWHYWFPCYNPRFRAYSPGLVLLLEMAKAAPELGLQAIDLGAGEADYKVRFSNASVALARGAVELACES